MSVFLKFFSRGCIAASPSEAKNDGLVIHPCIGVCPDLMADFTEYPRPSRVSDLPTSIGGRGTLHDDDHQPHHCLLLVSWVKGVHKISFFCFL